jgi:NADPH:quinone reductase-like Zn-dependent oxidoreductase
VEIIPILQKEVVIRGIGGAGPRRAFEEMNKAFNKFQLRPVIDQVYAFGEALSAFRPWSAALSAKWSLTSLHDS